MLENGWHEASYALPNNTRKVLCATLTKSGRWNIVIGYYIPESKYWACGMNSHVVLWREIPALPASVTEVL